MAYVGRLLRLRTRRAWAARILTILSLCVALAGVGVKPAAAQGFGWFGDLFGGAPARPRPPAPYPGQRYYPDYARPYRPARREYERRPARKPPHRIVRHRAVEPPAKEQPAKERHERAPPRNASMFVYVFGDSLGQTLANGLDDALSDRPDVAVVHKARGATGLIANDVYDWPKAIEDLSVVQAKPDKAAEGATNRDKKVVDKQEGDKKVAKEAPGHKAGGKPEKIDVAVMMIGVNDHQSIREAGETLPFGSNAWTAAYQKRVMAIDEAFRKKGVPLIWVGLPITRNDDFADGMAALNEVYRAAAEKTGAIYVDTWEAFSDDNGDFTTFGPDINGQTVRLRTADGIHFTRAGGRKLAHFVEIQVRRALDGKTPPTVLPTDEAPAAAPAVAAVKPDAGPIKNLNEPPAASDGQLAAASAFRGAEARDPRLEAVIVKGQPQAPPPGRADDLRWPKTAADGAATKAPAAVSGR